MEDRIPVNDALSIPRAELEFRATRSGGAGGQHVNTSSTKVELTWDVGSSPSVSDEQRALIREKLQNRIDERGILRLTSSGSRSQHQNREDVTERFGKLLADALKVRKARKKTKVPRGVKEARLQEKKKRGETKRNRRDIVDE